MGDRDLGYSDLYLRDKKDAQEYRRMQVQDLIDSLIEIRTGDDGSPEYWWFGTKQPLTAAEVADYEAGQTIN